MGYSGRYLPSGPYERIEEASMTSPVRYEYRIVAPRLRWVQGGEYTEWVSADALTYRTLPEAADALRMYKENEMTDAAEWKLQQRPVVTTWEDV